MIDFAPATTELARVVAGVREDQLTLPTPCEEMTVAALLDHVDGFAWAFEAAARKITVSGDAAPRAAAAHLTPRWREQVPERLAGMARVWAEPASWEGRTSVGGVDQTAAETGAVGIDEVVVHTWDLARATGQHCRLDPDAVEAALGFARAVHEQAPDGVPGLFGPARGVAQGADPVTELLALTGRDAAWTATAG